MPQNDSANENKRGAKLFQKKKKKERSGKLSHWDHKGTQFKIGFIVGFLGFQNIHR